MLYFRYLILNSLISYVILINMDIASDERARAFVYAHRVSQTHYNPARHVHASNLDVS